MHVHISIYTPMYMHAHTHAKHAYACEACMYAYIPHILRKNGKRKNKKGLFFLNSFWFLENISSPLPFDFVMEAGNLDFCVPSYF